VTSSNDKTADSDEANRLLRNSAAVCVTWRMPGDQ